MGLKELHWAAIKKDDHHHGYDESCESISSSSSLSELDDDASSSSSSRGPLYELNELIAQLPMKKGLSKFYNGKSQTFESLGHVKSVEDLEKKEKGCCTSYNTRMKSYYGIRINSLNHHKFGPNATIAKRSPKPKKTIRCHASFIV